MSVVAELVISLAAITCAVCAVALLRRVGESSRNLRRLLVFLDSAHAERRRKGQDDQRLTLAFHKTLTDDLRGCRNSIDAIREASDELSEHRRETREVRVDPVLPSEPAQRAAGLSRPKSARREPPPTRPLPSDPPPRSQTMIGAAAPAPSRMLPVIVPPPIVRPRSAATLPSMSAVTPSGDLPRTIEERRTP